ncbi:MAG: Uma2 family endonuclease [Dehalococcoidia bacterium]|nr:Uma2 family endonuclease [Dehalococcoidia bacterium]
MVVTKTKKKFTYEDYAKTPEGERYELLDGELIALSSPDMAHQRLKSHLGATIWEYVSDAELGEVYMSPTDVYFSDTDAVQPDILFFFKDRSYIRTGKNIRGAPDLVVEILSPSTSANDWGYKRDLYAKHGVKEYWLVDPYAKQGMGMLLKDGGYEIVAVYREDDTLRSPMLERFELDLGRVFDEVFNDVLADVLADMS